MPKQQTLVKPVSFSGIGIHSNLHISVTCYPDACDAGIQFRRTDVRDAPDIPATPRVIQDVTRSTTLGQGQTTVQTVEHLLSAITALGISNLFIEMNGPEIPAGDGSASEFVTELLKAGMCPQPRDVPAYRIIRPLSIIDHDCYFQVEPYDGMKINYTIEFQNPLIGQQTRTFNGDREEYIHEIAPARTFCLREDVERLRNQGLSKGGSFDNTVVFAPDEILNGPLRFPDEPVRHKILDVIGDLALLGRPLLGNITVYKGSHKLHTNFVKALHGNPDHWEHTVLS